MVPPLLTQRASVPIRGMRNIFKGVKTICGLEEIEQAQLIKDDCLRKGPAAGSKAGKGRGETDHETISKKCAAVAVLGTLDCDGNIGSHTTVESLA
jgi:hypothetical protein